MEMVCVVMKEWRVGNRKGCGTVDSERAGGTPFHVYSP